jgi:hypothetical protein
MSGFRETVLSGYLEDFIENREWYSGSDCNNAIHEYCDGTAAAMKHKDTINIIDSCDGVFKCIKNYIDEYGEFDFDLPEYNCNASLVYCCMADYIHQNYQDVESESD